jgi:hypothetical protein
MRPCSNFIQTKPQDQMASALIFIKNVGILLKKSPEDDTVCLEIYKAGKQYKFHLFGPYSKGFQSFLLL